VAEVTRVIYTAVILLRVADLVIPAKGIDPQPTDNRANAIYFFFLLRLFFPILVAVCGTKLSLFQTYVAWMYALDVVIYAFASIVVLFFYCRFSCICEKFKPLTPSLTSAKLSCIQTSQLQLSLVYLHSFSQSLLVVLRSKTP
jgi:nitrate reductase NapE component